MNVTRSKTAKLGRGFVAAAAVAAAAGVLGAMAPEAGAAPPPVVPVAADFVSVNANVATGTLLGAPVSLSGTHVWGTPTSTLDGSAPFYAYSPTFSPALAKSDSIQIAGGPDRPYSYTLDFGGATVVNPILHLASLGSRIDFPAGTAVAKVSGEPAFVVSGSSVSGTASNTIGASGNSDSSGTVKLTGTFSRITFTAKTNYAGPEDGILVQVGGVVR